MRNAERFSLVMQTVMQIATGDLDLSRTVDFSQRGPSSATISRGRTKLDVLAMYIRRWQWSTTGFPAWIVSLCQGPSQIQAQHI